ncbi:hypothetical protein EYC84_002910 [Monilinia fructicola]|uniref:DUF7587 domain-containing protein n=1 Tax=Monilinia fructicola TaxID=38448 RepID=A0A5M9JS10_MONFR|nr:hypothetical protein EYC84_002910 [Monilinia fructicola]
MPSKTTNETATTVSNSNKSSSVSSVGPLPATPDHTPKSTSTSIPHTTCSSLPSLPSYRSPRSIASTSIADLSPAYIDWLLGDPSTSRSRENDILLYRVHTPKSASPYSPEEGFKCSGWKNNRIRNNIPSQRQIDGTAFQNHCNGNRKPSPYISVHTSVARSLRLITTYKTDTEPNAKVFVISLNLLQDLGITAESTCDILRSFGGYRTHNPSQPQVDGVKYVKYVTDSHWLVEKEVPTQAIVAEMSVAEFLRVAEREGISRRVLDENYQGGKLSTKLEAQKIELSQWPGRTYREKSRKEHDNSRAAVGKDRNLGIGSGSPVQGGASTGTRTDSLPLDPETTLSHLVDAIGSISLDTKSAIL